jgi:hypothetical protein
MKPMPVPSYLAYGDDLPLVMGRALRGLVLAPMQRSPVAAVMRRCVTRRGANVLIADRR